jgi:hypothetical protein
MAVPTRTLLPDLPKGHRFSDISFQLTAQDIARYLDAVEDANDLYLERRLAPPLAVAARALGALLDFIELPAGALHAGQEVAVHAGVPIGATLTLAGTIAQRSERAGFVISIIEFKVTPAGAPGPALTGRTTLMSAAGGGA